MNKFFDYITSQIIASYYEENVKDQAPYLGEMYFPNKVTDDYSIKWVVGAESAPVAVVASNLDTDPLKRDREGFEARKAEMVFFREALTLTETQRKELDIAFRLGDVEFNRALALVFNDIVNAIKGARASVEKMRMELLATGKIGIRENGVDVLLDYKLKENQVVAADMTKPITMLKKYRKAYYDLNQEYPEDMIISSKLLDEWAETQEVKDLLKNVVFSTPQLGFDGEDLARFIGTHFGINVQVNDKTYLTARNKVATKFYPEDRFTFLPHREIGDTYFGTTPEMLDNKFIDTTVVDDGISISEQETTHSPLRKDTVVSFTTLPSAPLANKLMIVKKSA